MSASPGIHIPYGFLHCLVFLIITSNPNRVKTFERPCEPELRFPGGRHEEDAGSTGPGAGRSGKAGHGHDPWDTGLSAGTGSFVNVFESDIGYGADALCALSPMFSGTRRLIRSWDTEMFAFSPSFPVNLNVKFLSLICVIASSGVLSILSSRIRASSFFRSG